MKYFKVLIIITFLFKISNLNSQNELHKYYFDLLKNERMDYSLFCKLKEYREKYENSNVKSTYYQKMATLSSFFSNYKESLTYFNNVKGYIYTKIDTNKLSLYKPFSTQAFIDSIAKSNQIIILNEAHHCPRHRINTTSYLDILYKNGFRYLAIETLKNSDSLLNERGYGLYGVTGSYSKEPCYGDLIRKAIKLGFKLISYDTSTSDINTRERIQAQNIITKILQKDRNAKILIHCGYGHGIDKKSDDAFITPMGVFLKNISGIDPFVINQQSTSEDISELYERIDYVHFLKKYNFKEPTVFISNDNKVWGIPFMDGDATFFLPRSEYKFGRPSWRLSNEKIVYVPSIKGEISTPYLIQAFLKKEGLDAIPMDQIEILNQNSSKSLILTPNETYIIRIIDCNSKTLFINEVFVEQK